MFALVLDDAELNNLLITEAIRPIPGCVPRAFTRPCEALAFAAAHADAIGIVVTDFDMPEMDGLAVVAALRAMPGVAQVPILMVTGSDERGLRRAALEAGVADVVTKPFAGIEVRARVANLMALSRAYQDQRTQSERLAREVESAVAVIEAREREIITVLMRAAEHRDVDTGDHVARVAESTGLIAAGLGLDPARCRMLSLASTMHDVGKIGIRDAVLLKPGPLDPTEWEEMKGHAERGRRILETSNSDVLRLAAEIAASHHERWDGSGYPLGLAGEAIPLSGRIVAVADVFDALTSTRPYKRPWTLAAAREHVEAQAGAHFDPACVAAFLAAWPRIEASRREAMAA